MKLNGSVLIFAAFVCLGHAKVHLKMGTSVTVTFEGDELEIRLDNPHRQKGEFELCFRSTSDAVSKFCPEGYTSYLAIVREREIVYKLNRYGKLEWLENWAKLKIVFEADGSLNVMLANLPSTMLVYLPNAELPVVTLTMTTTAPTKVKDNKAVISIIGIVVLLLALLIIGAALLYCCWYKKRRHQPLPATATEEDAHPARQKSEEPSRKKAVISSPAPRPKPTCPSPLPSATATTKPPSTSTTKTSNEKVAVAQKPASTTPVMRQTEKPSCISIIPAPAYDQRSTVLPRSSQ